MVLTLTVVRLSSEKNKIPTVRAFGDLVVTYLGVPLGSPIFNVSGMLPGDPPEIRNIDVVNAGTVARYVAVKGIRSGPKNEISPFLEEALNIKIFDGGILKYENTLQGFFDDSHYNDPNKVGILLDPVNSGQTKNYNFIVTFPSSTENEFKDKTVIFDITFGYITTDHLVINEVFYQVDPDHGVDSYKDRGYPKKDDKKGQDDEWIELYNPTGQNISLKNWTLEDNFSGKKIILHANKFIKAGGFALIAKDASMWKYWDEDNSAVKIESIDFLGDGLDNNGDHLFLRNYLGEVVDSVGWGNDIKIWNPSVTDVTIGSSFERLVPGFDTDLPLDWKEQISPSPGF